MTNQATDLLGNPLSADETELVDIYMRLKTLSQRDDLPPVALANAKQEDLKFLVRESQTPKGLNEQGLKELSKAGFYKSLEKTLNSILITFPRTLAQ